MKWAAVIINYNAGDLLEQCVGALTSAPDQPDEIVVVDNASVDGAAPRLAANHPDVVVITNSSNLGYARAANLGIAATATPIVAVLNNDTEIKPGTGTALVGRFEREPDLGAAGPRILNLDGTTYPSARSIPSLTDTIGHGLLGLIRPHNEYTRRYRQIDADPEVPRDVGWLSGSAIWLRREALDEVGGWDERYFMYVEDVDLCWRLTRAGWRVAYEPGGTVLHVQGATTKERPYRMLLEHHRSLWRFADRRWRGKWRVLLVPAAIFLTLRAGLTMALHAGQRRRFPTHRK
jgi:N-acetylglucosaminyl-diphospho-decaprenol L-rhamnosyltransferase